MDPFVDLAVRPAYAQHRAVVTWKVQDQFQDGDFYVFKSPDGNHEWDIINEEPCHAGALSDPKVHDSAFYRVLLEHKGVSYDSPIVGLYDKLTRAEYQAVRKMMNVEYNNMVRGRQGIRMLLFTPLKTGVLAPGTDPQTGQRFSTGLPDAPELDSFGELFVGGYASPVLTYVKFSAMAQMTMSDDPEKMSTTIEREITGRMLSFPIPNRGDLLVHPETDNRYVLGESVTGYYFRGSVPMAFDMKLSFLYRTDPRYRVPVPHLEPEERV